MSALSYHIKLLICEAAYYESFETLRALRKKKDKALMHVYVMQRIDFVVIDIKNTMYL